MNDQERASRISPGIIAVAAAIALSSGIAWFSSQSGNSPTPINPSQNLQQPHKLQATALKTHGETTRIYWLKPSPKGFYLVADPVKVAAKKPKQALEVAFQTLLAGPIGGGTGSTTIPRGTKLLGLSIDQNDVHVNLSEDFTTGGGSTSMMGRIGQVVYTASALNPKSTRVYIEVNGKSLDVLGGEGLELEQPLTRESFRKNYQL